MGFPTPDDDVVALSQRAMMKYESDKKRRESRRLSLGINGLPMVLPGRW